MKVKIIRMPDNPNFGRAVGEVHDVTESLALAWIEAGIAEAVASSTKEKAAPPVDTMVTKEDATTKEAKPKRSTTITTDKLSRK